MQLSEKQTNEGSSEKGGWRRLAARNQKAEARHKAVAGVVGNVKKHARLGWRQRLQVERGRFGGQVCEHETTGAIGAFLRELVLVS